MKSFSIGIDANEANVQERVGTGEYTYKILKHFHGIHADAHFHLYLRSKPRHDMPEENSHFTYHVIGPRHAWTRLALPVYLATHAKHHVFWNPAHYLPSYIGAPGVVTIHDLAYEFFPDLFLPKDLYKLRHWSRSSVLRAQKVIAVSEATKIDVQKLYGVSGDKIVVIPNGFESSRYEKKVGEAAVETLGLTDKAYILFVGTMQPRKNIIKLLQAYHILREGGYSGKLVIAGKIGWMADETLEALKKSQYTRDIVLTGYISDETKTALYTHADVFVLPSLYEGFGVPILEAFSAGCPVAASNNSSIPEVVGNGGVLFDPEDPADIAGKINSLRKDRHIWIKKGKLRTDHFSWEKSAETTLKTLLHTAR